MIIHKDFDLSTILWYHIGGKAKYVLDCSSKADVLEAVEFIQKEKIEKVFVCGTGANLLFTDEYFEGAVIHVVTKGQRDKESKNIHLVEGTIIEAFAGEMLDSVIQFGFDHSLIGLEWAGGLPGTVGAAVRGNVGAFGGEVAHSFIEAETMAIDNGQWTIDKLKKDDINFGYRTSLVKQKKGLIVLTARLQLKNASKKELEKAKEAYYDHIAYREENHPHDFPNTGSVFKNIHGKEHVEKVLTVFPELKEIVEKNWHGKVSVGYLNKQFGLSGYKVGGAQVSTKHGNFIDNVNHAKAKDVIQIITDIQKKYQETFGFIPEEEVEIVN